MGNPREILSILEIPLYLPLFIFSVLIVIRHGFQRNQGWIFLLLLSLIRMAGGVAGIIVVHNDSRGATVATIILNNIGISPLLMAMIGLLKRVDDRMPAPTPALLFRLAYAPSMAGLILAIIGGVDSSSTDSQDVSEGSKYTKIGVALFVFALLLYSLFAITMIPKRRYLQSSELLLHTAVIASIPFIGLRILFSVFVAFKKDPDTFSLVTNTEKVVIIQALMTILPEIIVETLYLLAGFRLPTNQRQSISHPDGRTEYLRPMTLPHSGDHNGVEEHYAMMAPDNRYDPPTIGVSDRYDPPLSTPTKYTRVSN
ncbi:hypothetical protein F5884DRAFT_885478 [Xylogone sp. PMI_703]|nr:hypothetical protein F5884DRAFT_885478 [Xylogone sp. PMI_703]